jgi:hypothetical protein
MAEESAGSEKVALEKIGWGGGIFRIGLIVRRFSPRAAPAL